MAWNSFDLLSAKNIRALVIAILIAPGAFADDHLDHLRMMLSMKSKHGPVVPQPDYAIEPTAVKAFNIVAKAFQFDITPSPFVVNQGDQVTLNISVPAVDGSLAGHGFLLETYADGFTPGTKAPLNLNKGQSGTITFTATTAGTFAFICTKSDCGIGHSSMFGQLVVNSAPAGPVLTAVSPASGSTSGGTTITINGSGFEANSTVTIGGTSAPIIRTTTTDIFAFTPLGPSNVADSLVVPIVVSNSNGSSASGTFTYTRPAVAITTVTPAIAPAGTVVTIRGEGFTTALSSSIAFGGVAATNVRVLDAVTMQATTAVHANGVVDVGVTVGTSTAVKQGGYTYGPFPARKRSVRH